MAREPRRRALKALGAAAAALVQPGALVAATEEGLVAERALPVPLGYFGLHIHQPKAPWPDAPYGRLRLWDAGTSWLSLQPAPERWEFDRLDAYLAYCDSRGIRPLLPLGLTPTWASARPEERSPYGKPGSSAEPRSLNDWQRYVDTVARRYQGRIQHYELWNEVNTDAGFFSGTPQALLELQRVAYQTLKAVDPGITFLAPSVEGITDGKFQWYERYLALMHGRYADVLAYHFYAPRVAPEALLPAVRRVRDIAQRHGAGGLPLWNTEAGYRVNWGGQEDPGGTMTTWPQLPPPKAAAWMARAYLLGWVAGLDAYFWYAYDNRFMGMVPPSREASVITQVLGALVQRVQGRSLGPLRMHQGVATLQTRWAGHTAWWAWRLDDTTAAWLPPAAWRATTAQALDGQPMPLLQGQVLLSGMPTLLAADAATLRASTAAAATSTSTPRLVHGARFS